MSFLPENEKWVQKKFGPEQSELSENKKNFPETLPPPFVFFYEKNLSGMLKKYLTLSQKKYCYP